MAGPEFFGRRLKVRNLLYGLGSYTIRPEIIFTERRRAAQLNDGRVPAIFAGDRDRNDFE